ncbi:hypothetical protein WJ30_07135 [Burkholderia diffusa]|nr:hypothetical protein WJ30_07135 [Burkholderia diffusa]
MVVPCVTALLFGIETNQLRSEIYPRLEQYERIFFGNFYEPIIETTIKQVDIKVRCPIIESRRSAFLLFTGA